MSAFGSSPEPSLLDTLLEEQGQLTAVERFDRAHDHAGDAPAQARYYRALIPLGKPRPGEQYAFSVDLDACTGCKACVSACHSLNGLDDHEVWRSTGLLHGGSLAEPYQQVVTTACHHCVDPACLNGCPVLAYEKDPLTGIVRHLDDQCIGCQYCVLKCPYDVPQYSAKRGIVRKCDMCHSRLAVDEAPACVQACPSSAIRIKLVSKLDAAWQSSQPGQQLLPGTVSSAHTQPTTTYSTRRTLPRNAAPADAGALRLEPAHWPLIWMLLLTQMAGGISLWGALLALARPPAFAESHRVLAFAAYLLLQSGLASSVFHLGRPSGAWRAFLGWRRSWMSREILAFGGFAGASLALAGTTWFQVPSWWILGLSALTTFLGLASIFCSAMIYVDTRRCWWRASETFPKFFGTTLLLGSAAVAALLAWWSQFAGDHLADSARTAGLAALLVHGGLFLRDGTGWWRAFSQPAHPSHRSARLIWQRRRGLLLTRAALFCIATAFGLLALGMTGQGTAVAATAFLLATFGAQLIERYFFFVAVIAPRMPGGFES